MQEAFHFGQDGVVNDAFIIVFVGVGFVVHLAHDGFAIVVLDIGVTSSSKATNIPSFNHVSITFAFVNQEKIVNIASIITFMDKREDHCTYVKICEDEDDGVLSLHVFEAKCLFFVCS
jgi:hypothetical protein